MSEREPCKKCQHTPFSAECRTCPDNGPQTFGEGVVWLAVMVGIVFMLAAVFS